MKISRILRKTVKGDNIWEKADWGQEKKEGGKEKSKGVETGWIGIWSQELKGNWENKGQDMNEKSLGTGTLESREWDKREWKLGDHVGREKREGNQGEGAQQQEEKEEKRNKG